MKRKEYTVKERFCPSMGENVIVRVEASAEHKETCVSCATKNYCRECVLGLDMEVYEDLS